MSGSGFDIAVSKNIPPGSGLGGGSGNAAVMLLFLDRYFNLGSPPRKCTPWRPRLGADVPFFFSGGTALGEGIGESLTPLPAMRPRAIALVHAGVARVHGPGFFPLPLDKSPFSQ